MPNLPLPEKSPTAALAPFRVVAYVTDAGVPAVIPYDMLTHINYAFAYPNEDGSFQQLNTWKAAELVRLGHLKGVKVLVSVGGGNWGKQFEALAASQASRAAFVQNLVVIVAQNQFDGVDMDWEFPKDETSSRNFLSLMQGLRAALPKDKLLTAAVAALGQHAAVIPPESYPLMDFVNIMAYDNGGAQHSSYDFAVSALDYWLGSGLPAEKAVLGVPFYAHPSNIPYAQIVKADPAAAQLDAVNYMGIQVDYNGIPTIQAKTSLAIQRASGIMFWTLEDDATGDLSLLSAIHQIVSKAGK